MMKKNLIFCFLAAMFTMALLSCNDEKSSAGESSGNLVEEKAKKEDVSSRRGKSAEGRIVMKVRGKTFTGTEFVTNVVMPTSSWEIGDKEGAQKRIPYFIAKMKTTKPDKLLVVVSFSDERLRNKSLSGTFPTGTNTGSPFSFNIYIDGNDNFTFREGTVEVYELTPELMRLKAEGTGNYYDAERNENFENEHAALEIELSFPNVVINGEQVKKY